MATNKSTLARRTFVKGSLASVALAGITGSALYGCTPKDNQEPTNNKIEAPSDKIVWSQCHVNCGGGCVLRWHVRDGKILYAETDNTGDTDGIQCRACLRGRTQRRWINSPDRLTHPMKRIGKRGEGKFEQISWDEAIDTIASELQRIIETYGNEAVYIQYGSGVVNSVVKYLFHRLVRLLGGHLGFYNNYSTNMMTASMPYTFGKDWSEGGTTFSSSITEAENSDLIILFGNSPAETRMGGATTIYNYTKIRESGTRIIHIDPRMNETMSGTLDEWVPIRTGTDAALVSAIAHELIVNNQVNKEFLDTYCIGYDEDTMPKSAQGQNKSYKDYIMGTGYDMVEKTPEWAAPITQIPTDKIRELAADIAAAKALFVAQGWGSQRHSNGENTSRAICMIPILTGQIGLPGTNTGSRESYPNGYGGFMPVGENPVKKSINCYQWLNAIDHGERMTALKDGVRGADKLDVGIKFLWNYAGNTITNQHGDINKVHDILQDESKCEFIVVIDTLMVDSAKYADILLPDAMRAEQMHMAGNGYGEYHYGVVVGNQAQEAPGEAKCEYEIVSLLAEKLGKKEEFTEGKTQEEWIEEIYRKTAEADSQLPPWEDLRNGGIYKRELPPAIGLKDFRDDPVSNPLKTPSGKLEIYSEELAKIAGTWELEEGDVISPIPVFDPGHEGYLDLTDEFPLLCSTFHFKGRTHSSYGGIEELKQVCRQQIWINPADAKPRNINDGDMCSVKSPAGQILIEAKVTPRVIPGTICIPQGAWHDADMDGDRIDKGGCVNTLTTYRPTPLAKGNGVYSIIVQVTKA